MAQMDPRLGGEEPVPMIKGGPLAQWLDLGVLVCHNKNIVLHDNFRPRPMSIMQQIEGFREGGEEESDEKMKQKHRLVRHPNVTRMTYLPFHDQNANIHKEITIGGEHQRQEGAQNFENLPLGTEVKVTFRAAQQGQMSFELKGYVSHRLPESWMDPLLREIRERQAAAHRKDMPGPNPWYAAYIVTELDFHLKATIRRDPSDTHGELALRLNGKVGPNKTIEIPGDLQTMLQSINRLSQTMIVGEEGMKEFHALPIRWSGEQPVVFPSEGVYLEEEPEAMPRTLEERGGTMRPRLAVRSLMPVEMEERESLVDYRAEAIDRDAEPIICVPREMAE